MQALLERQKISKKSIKKLKSNSATSNSGGDSALVSPDSMPPPLSSSSSSTAVSDTIASYGALNVTDEVTAMEAEVSEGKRCERSGGTLARLVEIVTNSSLARDRSQESVRYHLAKLKREETELQQEQVKLATEKIMHVRETKRVANEDNSRFSSRPKLHNRYVLLSLLGKGGFR